jgi:hypothetical protein
MFVWLIEWHPEGAAASMQLNVVEYFREVLDGRE